jgi:hypothetical protein
MSTRAGTGLRSAPALRGRGEKVLLQGGRSRSNTLPERPAAAAAAPRGVY